MNKMLQNMYKNAAPNESMAMTKFVKWLLRLN